MRAAWRDLILGGGAGLIVYLMAAGRFYDMFPLLLLGGAVALALYVHAQRSGMAAPAKSAPVGPGDTGITFDDIGGQSAAKRELTEALDFLNDPGAFRKLGIRPLKGILLTGPPGTGKTLLAKAAATYTRSLFLAASGSEFVEMYAGVGAQRVRTLFSRARKEAADQKLSSAVIFIDEIEVLGGKRGRHASHLEYDQTLNQLLVEMDGITGDDDVTTVVVAATNRPDLLDDALMRPGRFDRIVRVGMPDRAARLHILKLHCRGKPICPDADLEEIARATFGFSGAQLESLTNEAAILAWRQGKAEITEAHLQEAIEKVMLGERAERRPRPMEKERVAVHEAGHALVSELVSPGSVASVTVAPRGDALGYVRQSPRGDFNLKSQEELEQQICIALAGYCAERLRMGTPSTGASADFQMAARLAEEMVLAGMSPLGPAAHGAPKRTIFKERRALLAALEKKVDGLLMDNEARLVRLTDALLEEETLSGEEVRRLLGYDAA